MRTVGVVLALLVLMSVGCAGAAPAGSPGELRFEVGETKILVRESGAIIVGNREVAKLTSGGKVVDTRGQLLAFVHDDNIRLRGGASLPVKETAEGTVYLPSDPQAAANLEPMKRRLRKDDRLANSEEAEGIPVEGLSNSLSRRVVLLILVLMQNDMLGAK